MAYQENKPEVTDAKNVSCVDIQGNFAAIKTLVDMNHVTFGDPANQGKHDHVTFPEQAVDVSTAANEIAIYAKESGTVAELFLRREGDGDIINFTAATAAPAVTGTCTLPCGITMKWGTGTATGGGAGAANNFVSAFSAVPYSVVITQIANVGNYDLVQIVTASITTAGFRATSYDVGGHATSYPIYYIAIGR